MKIFLVLALLISLPARAQDEARNSYAGVSIGSSNSGGVCQTDDDFGGDTRCTGMMLLRLFGGHHFNQYFALEGAAVAAERTGGGFLELAAVGVAPLDEHVALYGRIGGAFADATNALTLAAGVRIKMSEDVGLRFEWQGYSGSDTIDLLSIGVFIRF